jgi:hypothetical protein
VFKNRIADWFGGLPGCRSPKFDHSAPSSGVRSACWTRKSDFFGKSSILSIARYRHRVEREEIFKPAIRDE